MMGSSLKSRQKVFFLLLPRPHMPGLSGIGGVTMMLNAWVHLEVFCDVAMGVGLVLGI